MKHSIQVEIDRPIDEVVSLFDDPKNYPLWMKGLLSVELKEGKTGEVGAKNLFRFKMGNREMEMMETVVIRNLPEEYTVQYTAKGITNFVTSIFSKLDYERTLYVTENEFQFSGFMRIIAFLMPGSFKKQSQKYLDDFKKFAENNPSHS